MPRKKVDIVGWKVFNSDRTSPVQGGDPVWTGLLPFALPKVKLDTTTAECGAGWNYCREMKDAIRIGGLWRTGRPSLIVGVKPSRGAEAVDRGDKSRASALTLVRLATPTEIERGLLEFSKVFGDHATYMAGEQLAWRAALDRPRTDEKAVIAGLETALRARGLEWKLRRFEAARAARDAWDAWAAWDARDAWDAWDAWAARAARDAWDAWDAWAAWDARDAWAARDAWDAWDALILGFASRQGWVNHPADMLTVGIRDAYAHGLEIALPTGPNELGWAVKEDK